MLIGPVLQTWPSLIGCAQRSAAMTEGIQGAPRLGCRPPDCDGALRGRDFAHALAFTRTAGPAR